MVHYLVIISKFIITITNAHYFRLQFEIRTEDAKQSIK